MDIAKLLRLAADPSALKALFTWPKFSVTSYEMAHELKRVGVAPATVIDVGANVGQFAVAMAKTFPGVAIHSFEPGPETAASLRKNVASLPGVVVYPLALGERKGKASLNVNTHSHSSSILPLAQAHMDAFPGAVTAGTVEVEVATLDGIFSDIEIKSPSLLKLDVQGYELAVLKGAAGTLARVDHVLLEISFRPLYEGEAVFSEILKFMESAGFELARPVGWLSSPRTGELLQIDGLFSRKKSG